MSEFREIDFEETPEEIETRLLSRKEALEIVEAYMTQFEAE
ncbi:MAG: hypothetical protein P1Q69_13385 [Candidatus Thorarchaeota archaeon]|nr:hypothetical protein [Candidatus Thorarchaeota archaeon]